MLLPILILHVDWSCVVSSSLWRTDTITGFSLVAGERCIVTGEYFEGGPMSE